MLPLCGYQYTCGYKEAYIVTDIDELKKVLSEIEGKQGPILIEIKSAIGSRENLGRPTTKPVDNKIAFMEYLRECN